MTLKDLKIGESATIEAVGGSGALRQHFLDMGVIPGAEVKLVKYAPMGDPMELLIHGYDLTLRLDDAKNIEVSVKKESDAKEDTNKSKAPRIHREHPGYGEEGRYHVKTDEKPIPKDEVLTFALAGNQNCGKTTLFNQLTGANQHVGNFPGVTVDKKSGSIIGNKNTSVTDLPGIYSLSPYSNEEIVSRQFIIDEKPSCIINIADAGNIERNLYLTLQLLELNIPTVLALNMIDEVKGNGGSIHINEMEEMLGIPVVPISALKGEGVDELIRHAIHIARYKERPGRQDFLDDSKNGDAVRRCLKGIYNIIEGHAEKVGIPPRFAASKIAEGDEVIVQKLELSDNERETIEHIIKEMEEKRGIDRAAAIADMRFSFIKQLCAETVVKPKESREHIRSRRIDRFLTGKYTAIPAFIGIMALIFYLTFNVIGRFLQDILDGLITYIIETVDMALTGWQVSDWLHSLLIDGVFSGVGSILSFVPIIVVLFFFLSLLEDSGYMARVAFVMDKLLRKIGLSGRSIVPMLIGFGCTVPGVMSSRTLTSARDRQMTIMLTPYMSCTAKLPIYAFFAMAFFPQHSGLVTLSLYLLGIAVAVILALIAKNTAFKGEPVPFVMELPNYRMPGAKNVGMLLWDKAKDFLQRAFTVIFVASVVIWFLKNFDFRLNIVEPKDSILASVAGLISPVFKPLGFGDWRILTSLITGFMAKESVVSTLTVLVGGANAVTSIITPLAAVALLVFCLLYTPCVAAIASIRRELGTGWALFTVVEQCVVAWIVAFIVRFIFSLFGVM